jgi:hypothetical protein
MYGSTEHFDAILALLPILLTDNFIKELILLRYAAEGEGSRPDLARSCKKVGKAGIFT